MLINETEDELFYRIESIIFILAEKFAKNNVKLSELEEQLHLFITDTIAEAEEEI
jgi:hypothetical protein